MTSARYSDDTTLLAAGFSESYVKLWNLKGDSFETLRSDGSPATSNDCERANTSSAFGSRQLTDRG